MRVVRAPVGDDRALICGPVRYAVLGFGWLNIGLGVLGLVLPVMPTTVFLLIALWAFSKSSLGFHRWLYEHPILGRNIRAWHAHRAIAVRAKVLAIATMAASLLYVTLVVAESWMLPVLVAAVLAGVAAYILTRPSHPPSSPQAASQVSPNRCG